MMPYYLVGVEFQLPHSAYVAMKRWCGGGRVSNYCWVQGGSSSLPLGLHYSQHNWKGQECLLTAPYMDSTVTTAGSGEGVASLLLDSGETPGFPPGHF